MGHTNHFRKVQHDIHTEVSGCFHVADPLLEIQFRIPTHEDNTNLGERRAVIDVALLKTSSEIKNLEGMIDLRFPVRVRSGKYGQIRASDLHSGRIYSAAKPMIRPVESTLSHFDLVTMALIRNEGKA